jgi:hypothetical protein
MFGPHFLACLAFNKFGLHQPLNSQRDRLDSQGIPLSLSTLADQIGAIAVAVKPVYLLLEAHTLGAGRLHADDTTVPRLAKYKTDIARMWTYVCDDAPFAGGRAPSALFYYSSNRKGEHSREHLVGYQGILQADNYSGYNALYDPGRPEGMITHAACWAHARRYLFELADIATQMKRKPGKRVVISPLAFEAVQRIDRIFAIERDINGRPAAERLAVRHTLSAPLVTELGNWMREQRGLLSSNDAVGKKMDYMLNAWAAFAAFLEDGRICLTTDGVEKPQSSSGGRFFRLWLPSCDHALVCLLSARDIACFAVPDFLDPVVAGRTRLAVRPRCSRRQLHLAQLHGRERRPRIGVFRPARQNVPDHHRKLACRRNGSGTRTALLLHAVEERPQRPRRCLG